MNKIYAFSDCHGDYDLIIKLLTQSEIIDKNKDWTAGDAQIVCCGDNLDRGPKGIAVVELLMRLESQAKESGGLVISLCGNHDALITAMAGEFIGIMADRDCYTLFMMNGGNIEEAKALSENPEMLAWMRRRPLMHKIGKYLFQHADSAMFYRSMGKTIEEINEAGLELLGTGRGAYEIFYRMTECRYWDYMPDDDPQIVSDYVGEYLEEFFAQIVLHGHTRGVFNEAQVYLFGKSINLDGSMSSGYRSDLNRGFLLELNVQ